ncbi:MAG: phosphoglycerate mutase, partial [Rhodobacteraceae bacterium]|nr:phosphoglycerate mutase [Paracoccaceae bacterium]
MKDFPELLILRHGETEWNATGRLQGSFDSTLTPEG